MKKFTKDKILGKLRFLKIKYFRKTFLYPYLYLSYWHYLLYNKKNADSNTCYYAARPNPGAGIGHQMANWIAGLWYARQFGLKFAYLPFSTKQWDDFLGFGEGETTVAELKCKGYKTRKLPLFNENNKKEVELNKNIIQSYAGKKIVFIAEQDQFYRAQYGVMDDLKSKFYSAPARKNDHLIYSKDNFNIAIHVRRGDIMADPSNPNLAMRYLSNDYFEKVLRRVVDNIHTSKPVHIYFFSQGTPVDYPEFKTFKNLHWCLDMDAQDSFLHFVYADLLITSKSSFSYKPALLNNGIKVCPKNFWHGYPDSKDWILCENNGTFDIEKLIF
jgi:hypothetical protein